MISYGGLTVFYPTRFQALIIDMSMALNLPLNTLYFIIYTCKTKKLSVHLSVVTLITCLGLLVLTHQGSNTKHSPTPSLLPWVHTCFCLLCKASWRQRCRENLSYVPLKTTTQLVEHLPCIEEVVGLNPAGCMIFFFESYLLYFFAAQLQLIVSWDVSM